MMSCWLMITCYFYLSWHLLSYITKNTVKLETHGTAESQKDKYLLIPGQPFTHQDAFCLFVPYEKPHRKVGLIMCKGNQPLENLLAEMQCACTVVPEIIPLWVFHICPFVINCHTECLSWAELLLFICIRQRRLKFNFTALRNVSLLEMRQLEISSGVVLW